MQPLTWWIKPFVVALGIDLRETVDLILLFSCQSSICFTVDSPTIKVSLFCLRDWLFPDLRAFAFGKLLPVSRLFWGVISSWGQFFRITSVWMAVSSWWTFGVVVALIWPVPSQWTFWYRNDVGVTSPSIWPWQCWYIVNETHNDVNLRYQPDIRILRLDQSDF